MQNDSKKYILIKIQRSSCCLTCVIQAWNLILVSLKKLRIIILQQYRSIHTPSSMVAISNDNTLTSLLFNKQHNPRLIQNNACGIDIKQQKYKISHVAIIFVTNFLDWFNWN